MHIVPINWHECAYAIDCLLFRSSSSSIIPFCNLQGVIFFPNSHFIIEWFIHTGVITYKWIVDHFFLQTKLCLGKIMKLTEWHNFVVCNLRRFAWGEILRNFTQFWQNFIFHNFFFFIIYSFFYIYFLFRSYGRFFLVCFFVYKNEFSGKIYSKINLTAT